MSAVESAITKTSLGPASMSMAHLFRQNGTKVKEPGGGGGDKKAGRCGTLGRAEKSGDTAAELRCRLMEDGDRIMLSSLKTNHYLLPLTFQTPRTSQR